MNACSSERQEVGSGARQCKEKKVHECLLAVRKTRNNWRKHERSREWCSGVVE